MKTASELQIRQEELDALVWVRDELAAGHIEHRDASSRGRRFTMAVDHDPTSCGAICCIGGWSALCMAGRLDSTEHTKNQATVDRYMYGDLVDGGHSPRLCDLFFPTVHLTGMQWNEIPVAQVVRTITNFLETGAINWRVTQEQML